MPQRAAARAIARSSGRGQSREAHKRGVVERGRVRSGERLERGRACEERVESGAGELRTMRHIEQFEAPRARRERAKRAVGERATRGEQQRAQLALGRDRAHLRARRRAGAVRTWRGVARRGTSAAADNTLMQLVAERSVT